MTNKRLASLTLLALIAFAGNSLLCRAALKETSIDATSFTTIRLVAGAIALYFINLIKNGRSSQLNLPNEKGNWASALVLVIYAAGFSYSYVSLPTATGALLLFGAVQATMIGHGLWQGERLLGKQITGLILAITGLVTLLLPGLSTPPFLESIWMLAAGVAWGIYSLHGKKSGNPTRVTTGNFIRAVPIALVLSVLMFNSCSLDRLGVLYALASGALASGVGYAIWYTALPALKSTNAATVQLSVPVIAALGGIIFLNEPLTLRVFLASLAILGGIALIILKGKKSLS